MEIENSFECEYNENMIRSMNNYEQFKKEYKVDYFGVMLPQWEDIAHDHKVWFIDHFYYPYCAHCSDHGGNSSETLDRGYTCDICGGGWSLVYICRNCSWEDCPKKLASDSE